MIIRPLAKAGLLLALALSLTACGETMGERAVTGGAMGAGIGAATTKQKD